MKKLLVVLLLATSFNSFANDFGLTPVPQARYPYQQTCDSPHGYPCTVGEKE